MDDTLKNLVIERGQIKAALTRLRTFLEASAQSTPVSALEVRLEKHNGLYERFEDVQNKIEALVCGTEEENAHLVERDLFENAYFLVVGAIREQIRGRQPQSHAPSSNSRPTLTPSPVTSESQSNVKLPFISLPQFDGSYENWVTFRETFVSLIHDKESLSNIEKFQYLRSSLTGAAARLIKSLGVSEANYPVAWETLKKRFEDPNHLIDQHVKAFFDAPAFTRESHVELRQFADDLNNNLAALKVLGEPVNHWDTLLLRIIVTKLDVRTRREWDRWTSTIRRRRTFADLMDFIDQHCKYLENRANDAQLVQPKPSKSGTLNMRKKPNATAFTARVQESCILCQHDHTLFDCEEFRNLSPAARLNKVRALRVCFNCLQAGHGNRECTRRTCRKCGNKHNTLLHLPSSKSAGGSAEPRTASPSNISRPVVIEKDSGSRVSGSLDSFAGCSTQFSETNVMLLTAVVNIFDSQGNKHDCRVLLDSGSQGNFITNSLRRKLQINSLPISASVSGIGSLPQTIHGRVRVKIASRYNGFTIPISCLVISKISDDIPNFSVNASSLAIPNHCKLADPRFYQPRGVDMLIGNSLFWDLICIGQHRLGRGYPVMQKTQLGWVLGGPLHFAVPKTRQNILCHQVTNRELDENLSKFWDVENVASQPVLAELDTMNPCEQHFVQTTTRNTDGRFVVSIPFTDKMHTLGTSRQIAERRFRSLERKFERQEALKKAYIEFMSEYERLGHMEPIPLNHEQDDTLAYYLPHHAVFKENSTTTKLRVVFDGSARTSTNVSLNDVQHIGPTVQDDLFSIILRFRSYRYVISADVEKMYRQIHVRTSDRRFQRILWRADPSHPITTFELKTVTYGTASAPYLATRALRQLAIEFNDKFPIASRAIKRDFYVDDLLTGADTIEEAKYLKDTIVTILRTARFELRKWASNERTILNNQDGTQTDLHLQADKDPKTLGLLWSTRDDQLRFLVQHSKEKRVTKRIILSEIAKLFDPLGLLGPVIVTAKMILQQLWQLQTSWDESLPHELHSRWIEFRKQLLALHTITVPRFALVKGCANIEIHGFCDASEKAYGACIYLRSTDSRGNTSVHLLCGKSRVAPLKTISLPRLELCGATLLAQLSAKVKSALDTPKVESYFWCDSTIVLAWIRASPSRWKTFVANRTTEIQQLTNPNWRHVSTKENPADVISRGTTPEVLATNTLWWHGPPWLKKGKNSWPSECATDLPTEDIPEARSLTCNAVTATISTIFQRWSSLNKLIRVVAYCLRFYNNIRRTTIKNQSQDPTQGNCELTTHAGNLHAKEFISARNRLMRIAQMDSFPAEYHALTTGVDLQKHSKLRNLSPFLDEGGVLRVGGRLQNAPITYGQQHPVILSPKHPLTRLLIEHEHQRLLHAGCQSVLASLRMYYWILTGKSAVKCVLRNCVRCFKTKPISMQHPMGNLPAERVTPARPFYTCGVDYAGPIFIKEKSRKQTNIKAYICIFVCFVTKAVHLELATDLSTEAFLNCFRRFVSRRGRCHSIYSDNGTNFIGARNELADLGVLMASKDHQKRVAKFFCDEQMQWHLIPPHAPHFGGLWESAVKSAKTHLRRVIGLTRLTFEELYTLLVQIEACMNSRPLCPLSHDPTDIIPLTPAHFLIGDSMISLPQLDVRDVPENRLNRYQLLQNMLQHFWQRWYKEYLHQLQQRNKWQGTTTGKLAIGTLVLLKDDNLPPLRWRLGRITQTHPGKDNVVRVVSVKISEGIVKRPVRKICILPIPDAEVRTQGPSSA